MRYIRRCHSNIISRIPWPRHSHSLTSFAFIRQRFVYQSQATKICCFDTLITESKYYTGLFSPSNRARVYIEIFFLLSFYRYTINHCYIYILTYTYIDIHVYDEMKIILTMFNVVIECLLPHFLNV